MYVLAQSGRTAKNSFETAGSVRVFVAVREMVKTELFQALMGSLPVSILYCSQHRYGATDEQSLWRGLGPCRETFLKTSVHVFVGDCGEIRSKREARWRRFSMRLVYPNTESFLQLRYCLGLGGSQYKLNERRWQHCGLAEPWFLEKEKNVCWTRSD